MTLSRNRALLAAGQVLLAAGLLLLVWRFAEGPEAMTALAGADWRWLIPAFPLVVLQVVLSAERWRLALRGQGGGIGRGRAIAEVFASTFLNQTMPSGLMGEAARIFRDARGRAGLDRAGLQQAIRGVAYERGAGQVVVIVAALPGAFVLGAEIGLAALTAVLAAALIAVVAARRSDFWAGFLRSLATGREAGAIIGLSVAITASYIAVFWLCARAIGHAPGPLESLFLFAPALLAMLLPATVGGWGLREAASAALWGAAGLAAADGFAAAILYGLVNLAAATPGLVVVLGPRGWLGRQDAA